MGNRYRCAGTASETYINGVMTNDRVDIKSFFLPFRCIENEVCFAELNNKIYIANLTDYPVTQSYIYTFDGSDFNRVAAFSWTLIRSMCSVNNTIYLCDEVNLFRLDGDTLTIITTIPENDGSYDYTLFSLGQYMYLLSCSVLDGYTNHLYRFTGSGWTEIDTISGKMKKPNCVLYNGAIHIMSFYLLSQSIVIHKVFNGSTITDAPVQPYWIPRNAVYVFNNKLRGLIGRSGISSVQNGSALDFDGNSWTVSDILSFDDNVNRERLLFDYYQAFTLKGKQYLFSVMGSMMMEITNPIRLSQYFVS